MTISAIVLSILQATVSVEPLPVDEQMAAYEAAYPGLSDSVAEAEADIGRLGPAQAGWSTSGVSVASAIAARHRDPEEYVLGEWTRGGHGVSVPGDRPLVVPQIMRRYTVREYGGQADYHYYFRLSPGLVLHTFGSVRRIGNAECTGQEGIELISRHAWRDWSSEHAVVAFGAARGTRDDRRILCTIYRPADDGRFLQLAYTSDGQPSLLVNEDPEAFTVTSRTEAAARIFGPDTPQPALD